MSTKKKNRGKKPLRLCVCCGSEKPKGDMLRVLVSGRNTVVEESKIDETGKQHGRGAYICKNEKCIQNAFETALIDEETRDSALLEFRNTIFSLLGISMKAGRLASGEFQCEEAVTKGSASYVIIAEDASDNTKKKFANKCEFYEVPYKVFGSKEVIGQRIGKNDRSVVALLDTEFGAQFDRLFGGNE